MPAITVHNVSKCFRLETQQPFLAKELWRRVLQRPSRVEEHWALRDITFEVENGESVAVVGMNGSGKSTLLSLIAQTSYPTTGTVEVEGRIGPLLELGAGFHPDLTGRENVYLNGALLGLRREEIDAKFESIAAYADIGAHLDAPLHTYSTGMWGRLGFAVLAHIDPDVLIVDETLSVGDADFQRKCERTMRQQLARGMTMFLVSHSMETVRELCGRAILLHEGRIHAMGPTDDVLRAYDEVWHRHHFGDQDSGAS